jgi:hypothetical protein
LLTESLLRKIRLALTIFFAVIAAWGLTSGLHWLVLVPLSFLATSALLPNANPVLYWPIGLLGIIVSSFCGYCFLWLTKSGGVDSSFSRVLFAILIVGFLCIAVTRLWRKNYSAVRILTLKPIVTTFMILLPVILIVIVTHRFFDNSTNLISGFISGGDHNAHNEITHNLLAWSGNVNLESPITINTYPQGLHFLIANLIAITGNSESIPRLVQELRMGAWFEWVQLAAFFQLAILIVMKGARGSGIKRSMLLGPIFFVFASMDNFVAHLFWSGFTTSLGITWLFLIPFALPMVFETQRKSSEVFSMQFLWFVFLGIGAWLMYQPYAVVFAAVGVTTLCVRPLTRILKRPLSRFGITKYVLPSTLVVFLVLAIVLSLYLFLGRDSSAVTSLLLDGATTRPFFYTVCMWALLAVVFLRSETFGDGDNSFASSSVFLGLVTFTFAMMLIVLRTSDFGLTNQPYYVQKMLWVILFVSIPIVVGSVLTYFEQFLLTRNDSFLSYYATAVCVLLLTPLVMGRYPTAAFRHGSVDWFAKGISSTFEDVENNKVAFSANDRLGSHLSNLALRSTSNLTLPIGIGLSGNSFLACSFMNKNSASLIYTTGNGKAEMELAGCDNNLQYVVDGKLIPMTKSQYFAILANVEVDLTTLAAALQHMPRGVLPYTKKGNFATGYHSSIVFSYPSKLTSPRLVLNFAGTKVGPVDRTVTVFVNGDAQTTIEASYQRINSVDLQLPRGEAGSRVEIAIDCSWSDEETQKIDVSGSPPACLKLVSMRLVS